MGCFLNDNFLPLPINNLLLVVVACSFIMYGGVQFDYALPPDRVPKCAAFLTKCSNWIRSQANISSCRQIRNFTKKRSDGFYVRLHVLEQDQANDSSISSHCEL